MLSLLDIWGDSRASRVKSEFTLFFIVLECLVIAGVRFPRLCDPAGGVLAALEDESTEKGYCPLCQVDDGTNVQGMCHCFPLSKFVASCDAACAIKDILV